VRLAGAQTPREEFNDYNFWHVAPPVILDAEDTDARGPGGHPPPILTRPSCLVQAGRGGACCLRV